MLGRTLDARWAVASALALLLAGSTAKAQAPQPLIDSAEERSGLFTRHKPNMLPRLPVDEDRDVFYGTQWQDRNPKRGHIIPRDSWLNGGMYGDKLPSDCTQCRSPFFLGSAGKSTEGPDCEPRGKYHRFFGNIFHPFKPVGSYYAGGCYVPIYDLDPIVPGPGPFPWNHFLSPHTGG